MNFKSHKICKLLIRLFGFQNSKHKSHSSKTSFEIKIKNSLLLSLKNCSIVILEYLLNYLDEAVFREARVDSSTVDSQIKFIIVKYKSAREKIQIFYSWLESAARWGNDEIL